MANELTIPALPCPSIDEIASFYEMLGFEVTYRQTRPNPYLAVRREDINLHFFGLDDYDPAQSYSTCIVVVPDIHALFEEFAAAMRKTHGKLLISGIPRMTRPRLRNDRYTGFVVIDLGGNWIRITREQAEPEATTRLANRSGRRHGPQAVAPCLWRRIRMRSSRGWPCSYQRGCRRRSGLDQRC
ncbi:hypothetical protein B0I31_10287 [Saccharothrix carnea]|uniref:VOC domain-containing protein n=1 Tax=Saccharothrix carnea TaxID=1280637 RepID=A0A2P8IF87_SACCR|nr:hypothetical protein B0I31_10287 [Saccharothrix carnea]